MNTNTVEIENGDGTHVATIGKVLLVNICDPHAEGHRMARFERLRIAFWFVAMPFVYAMTGRAEVPRGGIRFRKLKAAARSKTA